MPAVNIILGFGNWIRQYLADDVTRIGHYFRLCPLIFYYWVNQLAPVQFIKCHSELRAIGLQDATVNPLDYRPSDSVLCYITKRSGGNVKSAHFSCLTPIWCIPYWQTILTFINCYHSTLLLVNIGFVVIAKLRLLIKT